MWNIFIIYWISNIGSQVMVTCYTVEAEADDNTELMILHPNMVSEEGEFVERMQIIFPGTKWCGTGNVAGHYEDLGAFKATDRCCRDHDHCSDVMVAGERKYGLQNDAFYTRLICDCDVKFYECLKNGEDVASGPVGFSYFNVLGTRCYMNDYPIIKCQKYSTKIKNRCLVYKLDKSRPKKWQWFDVPLY